jgi:hypothetical protein
MIMCCCACARVCVYRLFVVCILILFLTTSLNSGTLRSTSTVYFPVFRGIFYICFFFSLYGICVFIWKRTGVSYQRILKVSYAHTHQVWCVYCQDVCDDSFHSPRTSISKSLTMPLASQFIYFWCWMRVPTCLSLLCMLL